MEEHTIYSRFRKILNGRKMNISKMIENLIVMAMSNEDKKRVDQTTRPYPNPWFQNYDYGGPEDGSETGPGRGLYNGPMDKYKSTREFIEKDRKRRRKKREKKLTHIREKARATSGGEK